MTTTKAPREGGRRRGMAMTKMSDRVDQELATAMRARDPVRLSALRLLKTALTNKSIERGHDLTEAEAVQVVQSLAKQRQDSITQFSAAGRHELADKERAELQVLETYLPPPIDPQALSALVDAAIAETGATSTKDLGRVMKAVMARLAGQSADGRQINEIVRAKLSA
jgi:uncharacterized protein YqeY